MGDESDPTAHPAATQGNQELPVNPEPDLSPGSSEACYFCSQRVYVLERISAEGKFFHRGCFTCHHCGITLRLGGYTFDQSTGRFYCELHSEHLGLENGTKEVSCEGYMGHDHTDEETLRYPPASEKVVPIEEDEEDEEEEEEEEGRRDDAPTMPQPTPKPRISKQSPPSPQPSTPVPKPRTVHLTPLMTRKEGSSPSPEHQNGYSGTEAGSPGQRDSRPKQTLRKLQLSNEEKRQLVNLQSLSADSDSETPGGSSTCSSSSATAGGHSPPKPQLVCCQDGQEEEGYWSGSTAGQIRDKRNRRCFRRKEEPGGQTRVRSKFSPWNLSSPRLSRDPKLSVLNPHPGRVETTFRHGQSTSEDADDDDDMFGRDDIDLSDEKFETLPSDPVEAERLELMKMRTLERCAKMSELQRLRKAQSIQRRLEEIEVVFKELEDKGIVLERALRGEAGSGGSPEMIEQWIQLVHQKNAVVSEESDLMVASRQLELEDKQSMLELELRKYMELTDSEKTAEQREEEERFLQQKIEVVHMRDSLVAFLEEMRLKEMSEEQEAYTIMEAKRHSKSGAQVHWA